MERNNHFVLLSIVVLVAVLLVPSTRAATYVVGDNIGWSTPSGGDPYASWASQQTFVVGDILVFNFVTGSHTVANVTQSAYNSCNTGNPLSIQTTGPARFTITTAGEHYFVCTLSNHCSQNQKLSVNAAATGGSSPSPGSPPSSSSPPPPPRSTAPAPRSAAPATTIGTFSLMLVSISVGLLGYYK